MHIESFGFRGLRKLHLNHDFSDPNFKIADISQFQVSTINIIVGPNGGGKSTVADLVRAMGDATVLQTIGRENIRTDTASGFVMRFSDGKTVTALFNAIDLDEFGLLMVVSSSEDIALIFRDHVKKSASMPVPEGLHGLVKFLSAKVGYRYRHDEVGVPIQEFIDALNADATHLVGLAPFPLVEKQAGYFGPPGCTRLVSNPITHIKNDLVCVKFNDDELQHNHVPIAMFPSGWRAFGGLVAWLKAQDIGSICVIEEPETHVHPSLLRHLMVRISELAKERELQIFITTHSSTLIDIYTWPTSDVRLFEADGHQLRELTNPALALANLGARPSDICQANGVIWVEGSSDRLYILHWLNLWCHANGQKPPIENVHFSFVFYGGAMLNHFSALPSGNLIEIFKINRNSIIVMDRDLDFIVNPSGQNIPKSPAGAKARIYADIDSSANLGRYCWITEGYTIESYLPDQFRRKYFSQKGRRLVQTTTHTKVAVAEKFRNQFSNFARSHQQNSDLSRWIQRLYEAIMAWNA